LTLDEAIKHCLEVAEQNETQADKIGRQFIGSAMDKRATDCRECAADHRQLAEWLTDYKELKNSIGAVKFSNMKEALELIREYKAESIAQKKLIAEYKRLLKLAVEDFDSIYCRLGDACEPMPDCDVCPFIPSGRACNCQWRYADEALALIGEDTNVPASADDTNVGHKSGGWISCKDKMPEDNTSVLFVYVSENGIKSVHYGYHQTLKGLGSSWAKPSGGWQYCDDDVTHWQPVPEPPKE
jgi:hypothetical protein